MRRREAAQRLMRAVFVVIDEPTFSDCLDVLKVGDQMCVEHFGAVCAIEALDKGVLIRLSRLDIAYRNALGRGPFGKGGGNHLRAVVQAYGVGTPYSNRSSGSIRESGAPKGWTADLDSQAFPIRLIDYVQCPKPSSAVKRVVHEVRRRLMCRGCNSPS